MTKKIPRILFAAVVLGALLLNVNVLLNNKSSRAVELSTISKVYADDSGSESQSESESESESESGSESSSEGGSSADCPWFVPSSQCNKRVESIKVTCTGSFGATMTYYSSSGSVVGSGTVNGATVTMTWGEQTSVFTKTGGQTGPYQATKVNCPTDGSKYSCQTYFPC